MLWTLNKIHRRESILAHLLNFLQHEVLNTTKNGGDTQGKIRLAAQLKMAADKFKTEGMNANGTNVDYQLIAKSNAYLQFCKQRTPQLLHFDPIILPTRAERLAFWINLYNVLVIDAVIRFNVEKSVTEGFAGILKFFRQAAYCIHGQRVSLEDIEHGILRGNQGNPYIPGPQFGIGDPRQSWVITPMEPRIHFAINCASRSCPPVSVYDTNSIDSQLNLAASNFITQETQLDDRLQTITTSQIFKWFAVDFGGHKGVLDFITPYLAKDHTISQELALSKYKLRFLPYDWHLNI